MSWMALLRYLPAALGIVMTLWYRNESTEAWGKASLYQLQFQQAQAANQSLSSALDAIEQQQEQNRIQYQRELTISKAQGELLTARWHLSQQAEHDAMAQLATLREAEFHELDQSTCNPEPTYTAWADTRIPDNAIEWLYHSATQAPDPTRKPSGQGAGRTTEAGGSEPHSDSSTSESFTARSQD